jgi:hypothetical protein
MEKEGNENSCSLLHVAILILTGTDKTMNANASASI